MLSFGVAFFFLAQLHLDRLLTDNDGENDELYIIVAIYSSAAAVAVALWAFTFIYANATEALKSKNDEVLEENYLNLPRVFHFLFLNFNNGEYNEDVLTVNELSFNVTSPFGHFPKH